MSIPTVVILVVSVISLTVTMTVTVIPYILTVSIPLLPLVISPIAVSRVSIVLIPSPFIFDLLLERYTCRLLLFIPLLLTLDFCVSFLQSEFCSFRFGQELGFGSSFLFCLLFR